MPIHPSCDNYTNTLSNAVATYLEKQNIYAVHIITRLDKNTSGVCIFAKNEYNNDEEIVSLIKKIEEEFSSEGRVLIRPSGTEPLVRVMIEGKNIDNITAKAKEIAKLIEDKLK